MSLGSPSSRKAPSRRARNAKGVTRLHRARRSTFETLENRSLLAVDVQLFANDLSISDSAAANDQLKLERVGGDFRLTDLTGAAINAASIAGATGSGTSAVLIPSGTIASITVNGNDGDDTLSVDLSSGPLGVPVTFHGGGHGAIGDELKILGGTWHTAIYNHLTADSGNVQLDADGPGGIAPAVISFTGIEPLTNTGSAPNVVFNLPANAQGVLEDDGSANGMSRLRSTNATFEVTDFANPSTSLTINGGGTNNIVLNAADSAFAPGSINVAGAATDLFRLGAANVIPDGTSLVVTGPTFRFQGFHETLAGLTLSSGSVETNGGNHDINITGALTIAGGFTINSGTQLSANSVSFNSPGSGVIGGNSTLRETQLIVGSGGLSFNGGTLTMNQGQAVGALPGRLVLNGNVSSANTSSIVVGTVTGPTTQPIVDLQGTRTFDVASGTLTLGVAATNGALTKIGAGAMTLSGANTYTGLTTVNGGNFTLNTTGANAISGNIDVQSGTLNLSQNNQIIDTATLTVSGSGRMNFNNRNETIAAYTQTTSQGLVDGSGVLGGGNGGQVVVSGATTISAGTWQINSGGKWTTNSFVLSGTSALLNGNSTAAVTELAIGAGGLTMTGADLNLLLGTAASTLGSKVTLTGNVTTNASATAARIRRSGGTIGTTVLDLGAGTRTFTVADGAAADDLVIDTLNVANGGVTKSGAGNLRYQGAQAHSYTNTTTVTAGRLTVAKNDGNIAIPGNLVITGGTAQVDTMNQFNAGATNITVNGGTFDLRGTGYRGSAQSLQFLAGTVTDGDGTINSQINLNANSASAILIRGGLNIPINLALDTAAINGVTFDATNNGTATISGVLTLAAANKTITVANGTAADDLVINGIVNHFPGANTFGFTKLGAGTLVLGGNNTYNGATTISAGAVVLRHAGGLGQTSGATIINAGASLVIDGGLSVPEPLIIAGTGVGAAGVVQHTNGGAATLSGSIQLASDATINNSSGTLQLSGAVLLGAGNLTVDGTADTTISGSIQSPGDYATTVSGDSPLNYWRLQETSGAALADATGNNPGTLAGSYTLGVLGPIATDPSSRAIDFTGGSATLPLFSGVQSKFSVEFWINPDSRTNFNQAIGNNWGTWLFHTTANGEIYTGNNCCGTGNRFEPPDIPANTLQLGQWHHFVYTFDNTLVGESAKFYKNGVLVATRQLTTGTAALTLIGIGASVDGRVSEFAVYNRALTGSEVLEHRAAAVGSADVIKNGAGTLTLSGANTYTGKTTINTGVVSVSDLSDGGLASNVGASTSAAANLVINNGTTLRYTGSTDTIDRGMTLGGGTGRIEVTNAGATLTTSGEIAATGVTLRKAGAGTLALTGTATTGHVEVGINEVGGTLSLGGTLNSSGRLLVGLGSGSGTVNVTAGTQTISSASPFNAAHYIGVDGGTGTLNVTGGALRLTNGGPGHLHVGSNGGVSNGTVNVSGGLLEVGTRLTMGVGYPGSDLANAVGNNGSGNSTLNLSGNGHVLIGTATGPDTDKGFLYLKSPSGGSGAATINLDGGTLELAKFQIGAGGTSRTINFNGGAVKVSSPAHGANFLNAGATTNVGNGGAIFDTNGFATTVATTLLNNGSGGLTKQGAGTLTLVAANTYSGATQINVGMLLASNTTGSATGSGSVSVNNGGTLAGNGSVAGLVTVQNGGTLEPGDGGAGILSTGGVNLTSGASFRAQANTTTVGSGHDQLNVTGPVTLSGGILDHLVSGTHAQGDVFVIIKNDGSDAVAGAFAGLAELAPINVGGAIYHVTYKYNAEASQFGTGNDVALIRNRAPVALPTSHTTNEDVTLLANVSVSDSDSDPLTVAVAANAAHGTVTILNAVTGSFQYVPQPNYSGPDSFTFTVTDGEFTTGPISVSLNVMPVPDVITLTASVAPATENIPFVVTSSAISADNTEIVTQIVITGVPADATMTIGTPSGGGSTYTFSTPDQLSALAAGQVTLTKVDNGSFPLTFTATAVETLDGSSTTANQTLTVNVANVSPVVTKAEFRVNGTLQPIPALNGSLGITPGTPLSFTVAAVDQSSADANMSYTMVWGDGTIVPVQVVAQGTDVTFSYDYSGRIPPQNYSLSLTVRDKDGGVTTIASFTVNLSNIALLNGTLFVGGTDGADRIVVNPASNGQVSIRYNNVLHTPYAATNKVVVFGNAGNDTLTVNSTLPVHVEFYGGTGNDYLGGSSRNDVLDGGSGDDRILGGIGNDILYGGPGNDTLSGGSGDDIIDGDAYLDQFAQVQIPPDAQHGRDTLNGDVGNDRLYGRGQADTLNGGGGDDFLRGGAGADLLSGSTGRDLLAGDEDNDKLYGQGDNDVLFGGAGTDTLYGGAGEDLMYGNAFTADADANLLAIASLWFNNNQAGAVTQLKLSDVDDTAADNLYGEAANDYYLMYLLDRIVPSTEKNGNRAENL